VARLADGRATAADRARICAPRHEDVTVRAIAGIREECPNEFSAGRRIGVTPPRNGRPVPLSVPSATASAARTSSRAVTSGPPSGRPAAADAAERARLADVAVEGEKLGEPAPAPERDRAQIRGAGWPDDTPPAEAEGS